MPDLFFVSPIFSHSSPQGVCLFNHAWPGMAHTSLDDDTRKMLFGSLFSLKQFIGKMTPFLDQSGDGTGAATLGGYYSFRTNNYKTHVHSTPTGLLFLLTTEPGVGNLQDVMRKLQLSFVDVTAKNPAAGGPDELPSEVSCAALTKSVAAAIEAASAETR